MHELGVVMNIVENVVDFAQANNVTQIETLVLQIGELSAVIPAYVESCYPAAVDGTMMQDTKLKIEVLPANALCRNCEKVFGLMAAKGVCPHCGKEDCETISGKELMIKEIVAC